MKNKALYYILNLTWGLPLTLLGAVVALALMIVGKKPHMYGPCVHTKIGKEDCGFTLGLFIFSGGHSVVKQHELGHTFQNAAFGPFMIPLTIISVCRYWMARLFGFWFPYGNYWLEQDATEFGLELMKHYKE